MYLSIRSLLRCQVRAHGSGAGPGRAFARLERELLGSCWVQNEQIMLKGYTSGLMPGSEMNVGLDAEPVELDAVLVWCWAQILGKKLTPLVPTSSL